MKNVLIFLGGATLGGVVTTLYFKRQMKMLDEEYQRIVTDEIERFIDSKCTESKEESQTDNTLEEINSLNDEKIECSEIKEILVPYNTETEDDEESEQVALYFITPDEYGDDDDYNTRVLTMFTDGVVTDEDNCIFDIEYFGEAIIKTLRSKAKKYSDGLFYIRDENEKVDYEVVRESIDFDTFLKFTTPNDK